MLELFNYEIVQNAFGAGTIVAIIAACIGYFVVLRSQTFASEALSDIGFAGATGAIVFGFSSLIGMLIFSMLSALGMGALGERIRGRDVEIGMVLSFALGLGVLFLSIYTQTGSAGVNSGVGILFGSILSVRRSDVLIALGCGICLLILLMILYRPLLFASIDPEVAQTRGVPVRTLSIIFLLMLSVTVSISILVVGVLLIIALLIAPAATALRLTHQPRHSLILSIILSLACTWSGLILAFTGSFGKQLPVGFYISAIAAAFYFISIIISRLGIIHTPQRTEKLVRCTDCHKRTQPDYQ
ncbi:metal ABC transporter permease [Dictyobacter aurantiacus]|uniref:ABC transporter permease n=1 Tax=Dictyobacter aurantiacus TaxID=1936993 RepID=A0A401ZPB8_9CHLR|nr:metal ABC transporter permease [Dictyobacter aurantiacus]GCE08717.1 ABC transporter permease [Dictyobacter aurantiacus]